MIYVVLGMHKSGTTLISQILHKSGINMGEFDESVSYDKGNHYERHEGQLINREILKCADAHSLDVISPVSFLQNESGVRRKIEKLVSELDGRYSNWGFKDPRTCLTYEVWRKYLPKHKVIYVYRNPLELWHHYRRHIPRRKIIQRSVQGYKALRAWYIYNSVLLGHISDSDTPYHIIHFSEFMNAASELDRLRRFTGISMADCRKKKLYRSKSRPDGMYKVCSALLARRYGQSVDKLYALLNQQRARMPIR